VINRLTALKIP